MGPKGGEDKGKEAENEDPEGHQGVPNKDCEDCREEDGHSQAETASLAAPLEGRLPEQLERWRMR